MRCLPVIQSRSDWHRHIRFVIPDAPAAIANCSQPTSSRLDQASSLLRSAMHRGSQSSAGTSQRCQSAVSTIFNSAAPPPPMLHGCLRTSPGHVVTLTNSFCAGRVQLSTIDRQTSPCAGSSGVLGSPRMPSTARTCVADRPAVAAEQDHRRRAVAGDVGPRGVDDVGQVDRREELLDQLLAELALHERVGRDHPDVAGRSCPSGGEGQVEEPLGERHASEYCRWQVVVARRGSVVVQRRVLDRDVRRVADDRRGTAGPGSLPAPPGPRWRRAGRPRLRQVAAARRDPPAGRSVSPCIRLSPMATWTVPAGRLVQPARRRRPASPRRSAGTARSPPRTGSGPPRTPRRAPAAPARPARSPARARVHSRNSRRNAPSRKWPEPQVGSISRTASRPNSSRAGVSVWSRMNSSTNSGVCNSAYFLRAASERSWYRSPRNRVSPPSTRKDRRRPPISGSISRQNASSRAAPSPEGPTAQTGVLPSANRSRAAGIEPTLRKTSSR